MSNDVIVLLGRILLAIIFIFSGFGKLTDLGGTAGYFGGLGLPLPQATAWLVALVEFLGGLGVLVGFQTRISAVLLAIFTFASAFIAHFNFADQMQLIQFLKNLAITGGFLALIAHGPGALSIDSRRR
ncbi:DoxX family protein [Chelativorans sp.]|uniref:DoxX family protein n=1 Tax=Chelativorans sp. TaxID=2203393 RepID=UPI002811F537|nr:DoxX family protein [Chelativorans sp.]